MSWLRNPSIAFARQLSKTLDPRHDYEPQACYSSFCKHWQQAYDIIQKSQPRHLHDDVLGVVNHLEQLSTLLVLEARAREIHSVTNPAECLEYLLSENILDKLYEWTIVTGKYENAVRFEQLKLYGNLIGHYSSQVLAAEPFLRPLLKLLSSFRNELPPPNVETQLVTVLNQLCVSLMQNMKFIDLFFLTTHTQEGSISEFIIVRLLLSSVHREARTGSTARDALLLCAKMSAMNEALATYMLRDSNTCPVLATGLSGLYSLLPNRLQDKVYKLTPDDVNNVHKLMLFVDSLEFCNAVAQVAHPSIKKHLLDLLYQGFLVPVMGPALLQPWQNKGGLQSGTGEQTAAMAYLELIVRCSTQRGLLRTVLEFLLQYEYDGVRIIDVMLARLDGESQLSLVALSLMETLVELNSEDVMLELVYKYLLNGHHLAVQHRNRISDPEPYREAAISFLSLTPNCCYRPLDKTRHWVEDMTLNGKRILEFKQDDGGRSMNGVNEGIAMDNLIQEIKYNYGNPNDTLFGNFHAYLCDARFEIISRTVACLNWSSKYDAVTQPKRETNNNAPNKEPKEIDIPQVSTKEPDSLISVCTSGYETLKTSDTSEKEPHSLTSLVEDLIENTGHIDKTAILEDIADLNKEHDSLNSFGDGYDSLRFRLDDDDEGFAEESFVRCLKRLEPSGRTYDEVPLVRTWRASAESIIGPLLSSLLKKAASLLECDVTQNVRVTSLLSKLVALPTPLMTSLLLCPHFVLQPNVPSLFQILNKMKYELDELTASVDSLAEYVDKARVFLIHREMALVKTRSNDGAQSHSAETPQKDDSFRRGDNKRRSLSSSFSSMFGRRLSGSLASPSSPSQHSHQSPSRTSNGDRTLNFTQEEYWNQSITLRSILNAVILDEWVKELAALSEEHALRLTADSIEDENYIRSVAL